jgi:hypothetical protein
VPYESVAPDEWIQPVMKGYRVECCDCGLAHEVDFRIVGKRVQLRARRNNRATAQLRRARTKDAVGRLGLSGYIKVYPDSRSMGGNQSREKE